MSYAQECIADLRAQLNSLELTLAAVSPADIEKHTVRYTKIQALICTYKDVLEKLQNACHEVEQAFAAMKLYNEQHGSIEESRAYALYITTCVRIAALEQLRVVSLERITVAAANFSNE